jgi:multiple sugar transport system substrate-binding protein
MRPRRLIACGLAALALFAASDSGWMPRSARGQTPVEIELATWWWTVPTRSDALRKIGAAFTAENPGVRIKEFSIPYPRFEETLMVRLAAGNAPDILTASDTMLFSFLTGEHLAPLDSLVNLGGLRSEFVPAQRMGEVGGRTYGLLIDYVSYALLVNKRLLREAGIVQPPRTPEEFLAAAKKLTRAPDQFGYGVRHTMDQEAGWWYEASFWVIGFGGRWAVAGKPTVNSPPVVAAVRFFKQLYDAGIFPKGVDSATYRRMFYHEKVAMLTDNQNHIVISRTQNPAIEVEAVSPPFNPPVTHAEPVFLTIPKAARHPKEAAAFVEFFQRHLKEYGLAARNIVNSRSANEAILKESPHLRTFVELPVVPDAILPAGFETRLPEFRNIVLKHVSNVLIRDLDAKAEMDAAQAELEEKLVKKP